MNGDGWIDLVTHTSARGLELYLGDGTNWQLSDVGLPGAEEITAPPGYVLDDPWGITLADMNNNGNLDVIRGYQAIDLEAPFQTDSDVKNYLEIWVQ
jgi:hypothetical protein